MENTEGNGGPQADFVGKRELSEIIRKLKEKKYTQMSQMDVRRRMVEGNSNYSHIVY